MKLKDLIKKLLKSVQFHKEQDDITVWFTNLDLYTKREIYRNYWKEKDKQ